ncbi:S41 family peptidase [Candidatus Gracilibacteria bacterium]|nr:S41 family peptidase [Candidatus Gracilibacteria bacterium]
MKNTFQRLVLFSALPLTLFLGSTAYADTITRSDAFIFLANEYSQEVPESYKYIDLQYSDVQESSEVGKALQTLVYLDKIANTSSRVFPSREIDLYSLEQLTKKITGVEIISTGSVEQKMSLIATDRNLENIKALIDAQSPENTNTITINTSSNLQSSSLNKQDLFDDVYETLSESHYDHDDFEEDQLLEGAIKGLAEGTGDKYTSYFPPVESNDFFQGLDGEYEGIGAYIDMQEPGVLLIVSPIVGSPAEKAGLKGGDRVTHVDGKEITPENSQQEVISWIKGPTGTVVELTVIREGIAEPIILPITRAKIIIKDIEHELLNNSTYYIQIKNFGERVDTDFEEALGVINNSSGIRKIIIDLRNNPGGYLDEVASLLSHVVPKDLPTAVVSDGQNETPYISQGFGTLDLGNYEVVLLQNGGTASASEIMIGTLKDYFPNISVIGEQSFGKGSVQSLKRYYDGSTLKYTSAKWYTGKTRTAIDGIGITPDREVIFDAELFETREIDNQLQEALNN